MPMVAAAVNFQPETYMDGEEEKDSLVPAGFLSDHGIGYEESRGYGWLDTNDDPTTISSSRLIECGDDSKLQMIDTLVSNYDTAFHTDYRQI